MSAATLGGAVAVWRFGATSFDDNPALQLSSAGHFIFAGMGATVGFASGVAALLWNAISQKPCHWWLLACLALPIGALAAAFVFLAIASMFFTLPQEWFDLITDEVARTAG